MVTRPTQTPTWATDANYPAGADAWSGTPTRVEPAAAQKGTGHVPGERPPAQFFNWLSGLYSDWVSYFAAIIDEDEEHTYQVPKTRTVVFGPFAGQDAGTSADTAIGFSGITHNLSGGAPTRSLAFRADSESMLYELGPVAGLRIPHGAVIKRIAMMVDPGAARATSSHRMALGIEELTYDWNVPEVSTRTVHVDPAALVDDGTTNIQLIDTATLYPDLAVTIDRLHRYYVTLKAGFQDGAGGAYAVDRVHAGLITFDDPGPRNA